MVDVVEQLVSVAIEAEVQVSCILGGVMQSTTVCLPLIVASNCCGRSKKILRCRLRVGLVSACCTTGKVVRTNAVIPFASASEQLSRWSSCVIFQATHC